MAKKKVQHLYELLAQKGSDARKAERAGGVPGEIPVPPVTTDGAGAARRHIVAEPVQIATPLPVGAGQEHALENVVTVRRDTAIVGMLLFIVLLIVSFVLGRASVSRNAGPTPNLRQGEWSIQLSSYMGDEAGRKSADAAAALVKEKGYRAEIVKAGNELLLRVPGFKSTDDPGAVKALVEFSNMVHEGKRPFKDAFMKKIRR